MNQIHHKAPSGGRRSVKDVTPLGLLDGLFPFFATKVQPR